MAVTNLLLNIKADTMKAKRTIEQALDFKVLQNAIESNPIAPITTKNDILNYVKVQDEFLVRLHGEFNSLCSALNDKYKINRNRT